MKKKRPITPKRRAASRQRMFNKALEYNKAIECAVDLAIDPDTGKPPCSHDWRDADNKQVCPMIEDGNSVIVLRHAMRRGQRYTCINCKEVIDVPQTRGLLAPC